MTNKERGYAAHPLVAYVRSLPGMFYLRAEAAESLGCSLSLLPYLAGRYPELPLGPTHRGSYGGTEILLYTPERVEQIRAFMKANGYGAGNSNNSRRPRMFTPEEARDRARRFDRMRTYRKRAVYYDGCDRDDDAAALRTAADEVEAELTAERTERISEMNKANPKG